MSVGSSVRGQLSGGNTCRRSNRCSDDIRDNRLLWLLALVPVLFAAKAFKPEAHALLFVLSVLAIVPLAALLSHATESVAAKTGDTIGGLAQRHAWAI